MKASSREIVLIIIVAATVLFGGSFIVAKPKWQRFAAIKTEIEILDRTISSNKRMVNGKAKWEKQFDEMSKLLPSFPSNKPMDPHWRRTIVELAGKHGVKLTEEAKSAKESVLGDLCEMPIERVGWEADLNSIIHFLFDIQTKKTMIDVRFLMIKPKRNSNILRGDFSVYCAYTRSDSDESKESGE